MKLKAHMVNKTHICEHWQPLRLYAFSFSGLSTTVDANPSDDLSFNKHLDFSVTGRAVFG